MKHFFSYLTLLITFFVNAQTNIKSYDYFVQFNGDQLSKKVNIIDVLNHPLINKYTQGKPDFDINQYANLFKLDNKISVNGNFTDSIPYYQVTIPIKNRNDIKQFMQKMHTKKDADSIPTTSIVDFPLYSLLTSKDNKASVAWNDNYLVIVGFTKKYSSNLYDVAETQEEITVDAVPDEGERIEESPIDVNTPYSEETIDSTAVDTDNYYAEYENGRRVFDSLQSIQQNEFIKSLFDKGFTAPSSDKINATADISSWINYSAAMSSFYESYATLSQFTTYNKFLPSQKNWGNLVKGINLDFYFDNDNARVEEVIEYSKPMADIVNKIANRKINKNIFNYFPDKKPLGYMTYHINTKEALKNMPSLTAEILNSAALTKDDISIVTDLISTIVDEEATATLFDGDLSMFLHDIKETEVMTKSYEYDDNYEEIEVEKIEKKTIPLFSMVFTSTHPTFGDKLLQLGVRKKLLIQKGNYYEIAGTKGKYGDLFIFKDNDVVVIGNSREYFNTNNGVFIKEVKKDLKQNYFLAKLNIPEISNAYSHTAETKTADIKKIDQFATQFSDVTLQSSKKLIDNKLKFELRLNSLKSNKNIILQTLDFVQELSK
ncbi:hypothetical protein [Flavobacterium hydatis]|uniref:DUF4836 domain-containing protein n=1 Tax=Flavobacterium hydatis TaxID=991 RepID=A0A086AS12_FLAHY|nr:hypothetical protein [Flavobacterium hydatis]KFF19476.1 hypothetical protein IW20_03060 [Flavobacterium hydatis]OXA96392.1 hypothetical protein B0A62_03760 [Flavobacterium hydatis]